MLFVVIATDKLDSLNLRLQTREAHFAYAQETGVIKLGGPFLNEAGEMCGSLIIFEATDIEAARAWHASDPYVKAGLFAHSEVRPWKPTFNPMNAHF
ncbi:MAG: YciI family protein [Alphaproteobacteria bacterium]|nr:YciI family protein [Alphaproteobacteria bacterium]MBV9061627.1 YciI family protein [Alphaproteobacteria bacterium]